MTFECVKRAQTIFKQYVKPMTDKIGVSAIVICFVMIICTVLIMYSIASNTRVLRWSMPEASDTDLSGITSKLGLLSDSLDVISSSLSSIEFDVSSISENMPG